MAPDARDSQEASSCYNNTQGYNIPLGYAIQLGACSSTYGATGSIPAFAARCGAGPGFRLIPPVIPAHPGYDPVALTARWLLPQKGRQHAVSWR
jgi:hypothetical protein